MMAQKGIVSINIRLRDLHDMRSWLWMSTVIFSIRILCSLRRSWRYLTDWRPGSWRRPPSLLPSAWFP